MRKGYNIWWMRGSVDAYDPTRVILIERVVEPWVIGEVSEWHMERAERLRLRLRKRIARRNLVIVGVVTLGLYLLGMWGIVYVWLYNRKLAYALIWLNTIIAAVVKTLMDERFPIRSYEVRLYDARGRRLDRRRKNVGYE